jgi:hypothetical protein
MGRRKGPIPKYELLVRKPDNTIVDIGGLFIDGGNSLVSIDKSHAQAHNGVAYTGGKVKAALGDGDKFYIIGQNNNSEGKSVHVSAAVSASASVIVRTLGNITGRSSGAEVESYNRKTGLGDSGIDIYWDTTPDSGFASVKETYVPGGVGPHALGASVQFAERIIANGNWVGLEIENVSGGILAYLSVDWDFYLAPA